MKKIIAFILIILCSSCASNEMQKDSKSYKKVHWIMEQIIQKAKNVDDMIGFLDDIEITESRRLQMYKNYNDLVVRQWKKLSKHILENSFENNYIIEKEELLNGNSHNIKHKVYEIKIRSSKSKDVIWFEFTNYDGMWKFYGFRFCSQPQIDIESPCDKD